MSVNRHRVRILQPPIGGKVYYWDHFAKLPNYIFIDKFGKLANADVLYDESYGSLYNSPKRDCFGNRDCFHSYIDYEALVGLNVLPGFSSVLRTDTQLMRDNFYASGAVTTTIVPGLGIFQPTSGSQQRVIQNSPDKYVTEHLYEGRLAITETIQVITWPLMNTHNITNGGTLTYRQTLIPASWYSKKYGMLKDVSTYSVSVKPVFLGIYTGSSFLSKAELDAIFSRYVSSKVLTHAIPDNLTNDIFDQLTIPDVNNVENLKDFKQVKDALVPIIRFLRTKSVKTFAELYLWYKYTYSTTVMDLKAYFDFFKKWANDTKAKSDSKRIHLTYNFDTLEYKLNTQYTVITDTYNCGVFKALGLDINLSNTWDVLPFSFVVDWFINLGDIFAQLDHQDTVSKLNVRTVIISTKKVVNYQPLASYGYDAVCTSVVYQRTVTDTLPVGNISFSTKNPLSHVADGSALYIATHK